jgi:hypothetical protein
MQLAVTPETQFRYTLLYRTQMPDALTRNNSVPGHTPVREYFSLQITNSRSLKFSDLTAESVHDP